jgi:NADH-quinone oxidoreductase subunit G
MPQKNGAYAQDMMLKPKRAYLLLHTEPELDSADPKQARAALNQADTVIVLSAFKSAAALEYADVLLPIAPFTETAGTFVNCEGLVQSFNGVARAREQSRPAWKVLRVLGNLLKLDGFDYDQAEAVRDELCKQVLKGNTESRLSNYLTLATDSYQRIQDVLDTQSPAQTTSAIAENAAVVLERVAETPIYRSDALVRRAPALQLTNYAKRALRAHLPQTVFDKLQLKEGDAIRLGHEAASVTMPVTLDKKLTANVVRVAATTPIAADLGPLFSRLTVSKV